MATTNLLYLTVLPVVYVDKIGINQFFANIGRKHPGTVITAYGQGNYGEGPYGGESQAEQVMTLFPHRDFATKFFGDEVDKYIDGFALQANKFLVGGHVTGYQYVKEATDDGRFIVKVVQIVE